MEFEAGGGQSGYGDAKSDSFPQATTRVLTDEKGHSIKIRLASPPPQRQAALAKIHQKAREQQLQQQQQLQELSSCVIGLPSSEELSAKELPSICGTLSTGPTLHDDEDDDGDVQQSSSGCEFQQGHSTTLRRYLKAPEPNGMLVARSDSLRDVSARERWNEERGGVARYKNVAVATSRGGEEDSHHRKDGWLIGVDKSLGDNDTSSSPSSSSELTLVVDTSSSLGTSPDEHRASTCHEESSQTTTESLNKESTTSDPDFRASSCSGRTGGWDSRQDTSLDYCQTNFWQQQREQLLNSSSQGDNLMGNNETVMDADLRCANRLNLELLMMQNTALHNIMGMSPGPGRRTIFGPGFPQCGVLPAASEQVAALQQVVSETGEQAASYEELIATLQRQLSANSANNSGNGGNIITLRQNNSESYSSASDNVGQESRRSSSEISHTIFTPTFSENTPSLRILVKLLKGKIESNSGSQNEGIQSQTKGSSVLNRLWTSFEFNSSRIPTDEMDKNVHVITDRGDVEQLFEIHLLEVRNLMPRQRQVSGESVLPPSVSASNCSRRASLEGLFVRVFKRQGRESLVPSSSMDTSQSLANKQQHIKATLPGFNSEHLSIKDQHQHQLLYQDTSNHLQSADFIQLPLVKTSFQEDRINLVELSGAYKFVCTSREFPLRISLYQASRKANARYTLGHCLVSANCWPSANNKQCKDDSRNPNEASLKRLSSGSSVLSEARSSGSSEVKFVVLPNCDLNEEGAAAAADEDIGREGGGKSYLLEFRLFQTILEAV